MKKVKYRSKLRLIFGRKLLIATLILVQIVFLLVMLFRGAALRWISLLLTALSIATALHLMTRPDKSAFKLSLVFLILLFPLFGGVMYWVFHFQTASTGYRRILGRIERHQRAEYQSLSTLSDPLPNCPRDQKLLSYLRNVAAFPVYQNTQSKYFPTGKELLNSMLEDMRHAEKYIFLEYFIIEEGLMWDSMLEVLRERAAHGVDVRVLYDDMGCLLTLPTGYQKTLRSMGIQCEVFNPFHPFLTSIQNNRDHRKITVIDGRIAYTGGINLADEYINEKIRFGEWKDCAVRMQGAAAESFTTMFLQMWSLFSKAQDQLKEYLPPKDTSTLSDGWVQPYNDSPMDKENVGELVYSHAIERSQKTLYITTPYLMVGDEMISALKYCAKSGVDVRIITPGKPDKPMVHFTTRSYYRELIAAGVKIYEYSKGFIHSKTVISDDDFCVVGTTNMDFRSLYLHFECGACFYDSSVTQEVKKDFFHTLEQCRQVTVADCKTNFLVKTLQDVCRLFAPLM